VLGGLGWEQGAGCTGVGMELGLRGRMVAHGGIDVLGEHVIASKAT